MDRGTNRVGDEGGGPEVSATNEAIRSVTIRLARAYRLAEVVATKAMSGFVPPAIIMAALIVAAAILMNTEQKESS